MSAHDDARERAPAPRRSLGAIVLWWRVARMAYRGFCRSGAVLMAAAIAFFWILCLGPLGILFAAGVQALLGPGADADRTIRDSAEALGAGAAADIMPNVDGALGHPSGLVGILGVLMLIWSALRLFEAVERSLTQLWPGQVIRGYFKRKLVALVMMLVAGLLLAGFMLFSAFIGWSTSLAPNIPGVDPKMIAWLRPRLLPLYELATYFIAFTLLYKFMPVQPVRFRVGVVGAALAAPLWWGFSTFFTRTAIPGSHQYGVIYGGVADVVVFSLWAFAGAHVLLIGAHFAAAYERVFVEGRPPEEDDAPRTPAPID